MAFKFDWNIWKTTVETVTGKTVTWQVVRSTGAPSCPEGGSIDHELRAQVSSVTKEVAEAVRDLLRDGIPVVEQLDNEFKGGLDWEAWD